MEKYLILGETPQSIVEELRKETDGDLVSFFFPDAGVSFLTDLLTPAALAHVEGKFGPVNSIQDRYRDAAVSGDDDAVTPEMLIEAAAISNPHVFFGFDSDRGFERQPVPTRGYAVRCQIDPALLGLQGESVGALRIAFGALRIAFGADGAPAQEHRAPGRHGGATFLRRADALRAVGRTKAPSRNTRVHVFVLDQGMHPDYVNALGGAGTYGGIVWDTFPIIGIPSVPGRHLGELPVEQRHRYRSMPNWHAHMIVRNILSVAGGNHDLDPEQEQPIIFYDVPVIPDRVGSVTGTAIQIWFQVWAVLDKIIDLFDPRDNDRFIIVNAWGVKNRLREEFQGNVTESHGHPLNSLVNVLAGQTDVAVVFAAGNTGLFTLDPEAGPYDRGPGRSIWLPNALDAVMNAAATDVNGMWIGSSSQGSHAQAQGIPRQPRFSTPSYFREDLDAHVSNTGTSASCALLAGLVAARWRRNPEPLNLSAARNAAKRNGHTTHSMRLGWGVGQDMSL